MCIFGLARGARRRIAALPADAARSRYLESLGFARGAVSGVRIAMSRRAALEVEVSGADKADSVRQSQFGQEYAV